MVRRIRCNVVSFLCGLAIFSTTFAVHAETPPSPKKTEYVALERGIVFAARLALAPASDSQFSSTALSVGYKDQWFTLMFDFGYEYETTTIKYRDSLHLIEFTSSFEKTVSRFMVGATAQVALVRWPVIHLDLIGQVGLGFVFGEETTNSPDYGGSAPIQGLRNVGVAPGLRYWLHQNCAVGLTVGAEVAFANGGKVPGMKPSNTEASPSFAFQVLTAF